MTINFRRNALQLSVAALFSSAFMANAADVPQVKVTVTDKQCEPMTITVNAGKTQFIIQNHSQKALEWEILKGVMVVEERENIAPGFSQKMTANLQPGEYDMTCGKFEQEWFDVHAPNGKTEILAHSAHLSWFEQPEKYTDMITQFVLSVG